MADTHTGGNVETQTSPDSIVRFERPRSLSDQGVFDADALLGGEDSIAVDLRELNLSTIEGDINAALEIIHSAPAFDHISAHELEAALGDGIIARIDMADDTKEIIATNPEFRSVDPPNRRNPPLEVGDTIPNDADDGVLVFADHPTGGPLFTDEQGVRVQHESYQLLYRVDT